jgi:16S rRNA (adenine1518-N6/adenine1519-N6)-dimethyltransferase
VSQSPREVLQRHGLRPKKSWGQNFLSDDEVLARITAAASIGPGDAIVELGAGLGHLTRHLLSTGASVTALERDRDMVRVLLEELAMDRLKVVEADAARADYARAAGADRVTLVGNLPYHLTSPILFQVLDQRTRISRAVFTVQKEVAARLSARPGGRAYGLLSVLLGLYFDIELLFALPARLFHPAPKVDSAVVRLTALGTPRAAVADEARFRRVVKAGFGQRRKTLWNALRSDASLGTEAAVRNALAAANVDPSRRAETLSPEEFAAIDRAL